MTTNILLAGFGGQGILFAGKLLASTGMYNGRQVTWLPSYGPEMRGGTANCSVVIADDSIGSPLVPNPDILIALNLPSYQKFHNSIVSGGMLISDSSLIAEKSGRDDITAHYIPATQMAKDSDMNGLANVIMLGKLIAASGIFTMDQLVAAMTKSIPASKAKLLELNKQALDMGFNFK